MELLRPDTAEVWASYQHLYWGSYAAITHQSFGAGSVTYLGCYMETAGLKTLLKKLCKLASIHLPDYSFPIIRKQGRNNLGKLVSYYFNYASVPNNFIYDGAPGIELLTKHTIEPGFNYELKSWEIMIVEEHTMI
jgi:beta-galactosidase